MFQQVLPAVFLDQVQAEAKYRYRNRVYTPLVVMWLLIVQRLQGGTSLQDAVIELLQGLPASFWPRPCKRIREWQQNGTPLSAHTGAYNQARQALPLLIVQESWIASSTNWSSAWTRRRTDRSHVPSFWMGLRCGWRILRP